MKFNYINNNRKRRLNNRVLPMLLLWLCSWLLLLLLTAAAGGRGPQVVDGQLRGSSRRNSEQAEFDAAEPLMEPMAAASSSSTASVQCEPISLELCSKMPYRFTRMPNFFRDSNQIEADDRSQQYQDLVNSKCSAYIHAYVCELLAPVCLEHSQEAMRRFEIYPCRSFCRRVQRDCEQELFRLNDRLFSAGATSLLPGFACELLPFESNGGNGTLRGPCHETPPESAVPASNSNQASRQPNNYQPYQPQLDTNIPPFITDTSRIDPNLIKQPTTGTANQPSPGPTVVVEPASSWPETDPARPGQDDYLKNRPQNFLVQAQTFGQNLLWYLVRYSNILSIALVICLLAALNSKRLRRLKTYFHLSPSSSTRSSTNSAGPSLNNKGELIAGHHKQLMHSMSPSASSRSLMLIAGNNKQPPTHQLLPDPDPSQKLLHGLQHQRTLINVNGTLERQQQQQQINNRYLIMQSANFKQHNDKQQLFNTLDSHSSSNQYDYIQDDHHHTDHSIQTQFRQQQLQQQQQQQQQMYSNILLSSPSHQVLLVGPPSGYRAEPDSGSLTTESGQLSRGQSRPLQQHRTQPPSQPAPALNSRHPPYFNATGPYAAPTSCGLSSSGASGGGCGGSLRCDSPQSQRSFQRRARKSGGGGGGSSRFPQTDLAHQASRRLARDFCSSAGRAPVTGYTSSASSSSASSSAISPPGLADSCLGGPSLVAQPLRRH